MMYTGNKANIHNYDVICDVHIKAYYSGFNDEIILMCIYLPGDATVIMAHRCTPLPRLKELASLADIVIAAAGPFFFFFCNIA